MTCELRATLHRIADDVRPEPVSADLWRRGRAAQRRGHDLALATVLLLVVSVAGAGAWVLGDDREAQVAGTVVVGGSIPNRIVDPGGLDVERDLAVGRASVALVASGDPVVVTAIDGRYHALDLADWDGKLVSLSPDGLTLGWTFDKASTDQPRRGLGLLDLETGETSMRGTVSGDGAPITAEQVSWSAGSQWLTWSAEESLGRIPVGPGDLQTTTADEAIDWTAVDDDGVVTLHAGVAWRWGPGGTLEPMTMNQDLNWGADISERIDGAVASPTGNTFALATSEVLPAADFLVSGRYAERTLPTDLYPDGAAVQPLGWATDSLVLARVDAPDGSYVEGPHLALFTAPNQPEQSWSYRIVARDVPGQVIAVAVDLIPDLDGTSSQQLTQDFPVPEERDISWMIGLGVAAAVAVLLALQQLWRRFTR